MKYFLASFVVHLALLVAFVGNGRNVHVQSDHYVRVFLAPTKTISKQVDQSIPSSVKAPSQVELRPSTIAQETMGSGEKSVVRASAPVLRGKFSPKYPHVSRMRGEQGRVLLKIQVAKNGRVESVLIEKSSGFEELDEAALKGAHKLQFEISEKMSTKLKPVMLAVNFELN